MAIYDSKGTLVQVEQGDRVVCSNPRHRGADGFSTVVYFDNTWGKTLVAKWTDENGWGWTHSGPWRNFTFLDRAAIEQKI